MAFCSKCGAELPADAQYCHKCGTPVGVAVTPEVQKTFTVEGSPRIVVRSSVGSGSIQVKAGGVAEVSVDVKMKGPEQLGYDLTQTGREILVRCWPRVHPAVSWFYYLGTGVPRADITIVTPASSDLEIDSPLSSIMVTGLKGDLSAESAVSTVRFNGCEGRLRARTRTGSVEIQDFKGNVTSRSHVGSISFSGSLSAQGENFFRTNVGSIQLALHGEQDLTAELLTNIGAINCVPELTDARRDYGRYRGRIGAGTGRLTAQTNTGSINVSH